MRRLGLLLLTPLTAHAVSFFVPIWTPLTPDEDSLFRFVRNGKAGFINQTGQVVVPATLPLFDNWGPHFRGGVSYSGVFTSSGCFHASGRRCSWTGYTTEFREGLASTERDGRWFFIDAQGRQAVPGTFEGPGEFSEGLSPMQQAGKFGFIDRSGRFVIAPQFVYAAGFSEGMALVVVNGPCELYDRSYGNETALPRCAYTYVDRAGQGMGRAFDVAHQFSEGLAVVKVAGRWGYVDRAGRLAIPLEYDGPVTSATAWRA